MPGRRSDYGSIVRRRKGDGCIMPVGYRGKEPLRPHFYVRIHVGGKWVLRKAGRTRDEARAYLTKVERDEFLERRLGIRPIAEVPFEVFVEEYLRLVETTHSTTTWKDECTKARNLLAPWFKGRTVASITAEDVERFHESRSHRTIATRNRDLSLLSAMMTKAVKLGYARENPVAGFGRPQEQGRPIPYVSVEQQAKLIACCSERLRPLVLLALRTGLRQGELLRLEWRDVDLARGVLTVRETKNKEPRQVPLTADALEALQILKAGRTVIPLEGGGRVFWFLSLKWSGSIARAYKRALAAAELPPMRFHDLRHVCAVTLRESGVDSAVLGKWLGHKSPSMVWRYSAHCPTEWAGSAIHRLDSHLRSAEVPSSQVGAANGG